MEAPATREAALEAENARLRQLLAEAGLRADEATSEVATVASAHRVALTESHQETHDARAEMLQANEAAEQAADEHCAEMVAYRTNAVRRDDRYAALHNSEGRLRLILESATDFAIFATDLDGRVTEWNAGAKNVLGWEEAEILGRDARIIWTPDDREASVPEQEMQQAREQGRATDERWHLRRDGSRFWAAGELMSMQDEAGVLVGYLKILRNRTEQHEAGRRLDESEEHWRGLFARLQEGLIVGELVRDAAGRVTDWRYIDVNPAWGEQVGISASAAAGRTIRELFPGIEDAWVDEMAEVVSSGRPTQFLRQVGGLHRWYEGRAFPLQDDRFAVLFLEVTHRKEAEDRRAALTNLDDRLRDMADPAEMMFVSVETVGRVLGVQGAGYGTLVDDGRTVVIERDWSATPDQVSTVGRHDMRVFGTYFEDLRRGEPVVIADIHADARTDPALGHYGIRALVNIPLMELGQVAAVLFVRVSEVRNWTTEDVGFLRDVLERTRAAVGRRAAEHELRDLAASLERQVVERTAERNRLWDASPDLLLVIDFQGVFCRVNPAWTTLLGYQPEELIGHHVNEFVVPDDVAKTKQAYELAAQGGSSRMENSYRHKDGSTRQISWVGTPVGDLTYATGRDVTREKAAAEELAKTQDALRQSQKMEAVGQLTGGLAHDFNNLLTGVTGSLELMQTRIAQGRIKDVDRYVNAAQGAAKRAAALTHRLLAFSRRQTLAPKPTDVNRLVAGMEELIQRTVGPQITVKPVVGAAEIWPTLVDPGQLENALLNLCINARDAMPDGGTITIETANRWLDRRAARERDLEPGQYVSLCVSDTGTGMTPEVIAKAFDPFFTTKPIGMGTGLGLSMIYGFARQSGGQARIYSEVGRGTMVCLYLPRHLGEAETAELPPEPGNVPRAEDGQTVLVVDDEPTVRMLVTDVLKDLGYTAIEAADGAAGLKVLQSNVRIDLLVTDVGLPGGLNGRQVADAARVVRPELKVLFITGYAENAVLSHGHLDPGMHTLTKPFAMETLASRIQDMIALR